MMNAPKSIWPFSTSLGRGAKQRSVTHCVKAVGGEKKRDIKDREARVDQLLEEAEGRGGGEK